MVKIPDDQAPTLRPRMAPVSSPPGGDRWTPRNVAWLIVFVATALGLPALISGVIVPAMTAKPAAQADLGNVAARTAADAAELAQDLGKLRRTCAPAAARVDDLDSQMRGILARLDALEKKPKQPRTKPKAPAANTASPTAPAP